MSGLYASVSYSGLTAIQQNAIQTLIPNLDRRHVHVSAFVSRPDGTAEIHVGADTRDFLLCDPLSQLINLQVLINGVILKLPLISAALIPMSLCLVRTRYDS